MSRNQTTQFGAPNCCRAPAPSARGQPDGLGSVVLLIEALHSHETREQALHLLAKKRERQDLAPLLWHSFGTITILLQEIISVYQSSHLPNLIETLSNRVCNALVLLQCVAAHPETKMKLIKANIHIYLYSFLTNPNTGRPYEYLRLTSLGVIGALVKVDDPQVVRFLLNSQIFPYCLRCMEVGSDLSKTVATFIVYKILVNDDGLRYCCTLAERFYAVGRALGNMVEKLAEDGSPGGNDLKRLLKHIIWCYHRLSENPRACGGLRHCFPKKLADLSFINVLLDDQTAMVCLKQLFRNLSLAQQSIGRPVQPLMGQAVRG